jgi:hypothetical protein
MEETIMFVANLRKIHLSETEHGDVPVFSSTTHPKKRKTACANFPQRAPIISSQVYACGALSLSFAESW